jgi:hypothetical protein
LSHRLERVLAGVADVMVLNGLLKSLAGFAVGLSL